MSFGSSEVSVTSPTLATADFQSLSLIDFSKFYQLMAILDKFRQIESIEKDWRIAALALSDSFRIFGQDAAANFVENAVKNEDVAAVIQAVITFVWHRYFSGNVAAFSDDAVKQMALADYAKWIPMVLELIKLWRSLRGNK